MRKPTSTEGLWLSLQDGTTYQPSQKWCASVPRRSQRVVEGGAIKVTHVDFFPPLHQSKVSVDTETFFPRADFLFADTCSENSDGNTMACWPHAVTVIVRRRCRAAAVFKTDSDLNVRRWGGQMSLLWYELQAVTVTYTELPLQRGTGFTEDCVPLAPLLMGFPLLATHPDLLWHFFSSLVFFSQHRLEQT